MPKVRLNYDGWLLLPEAARRALGVGTGDQLDLEVAGRTVVLRPARGAEADAALPAEAATPEPEPVASVPQAVERRKPGRPRKATAPLAADPAPATKPRARGRRATSPGTE